MRRGWRAGAIAVVAQLMLAGVVLAASVAADGWTLTMDPTTLKPGVATNVTLRATDTDGSGDIGCVWLVIPDSFEVHSVVALGTSTSDPWKVKIKTQGPGTKVEVFEGNDKLKEGDWVEFRVRVTGADSGAWTGYASQGNACKDEFLDPIKFSVTVSAPAPTAAPTATPKPTAKPTAAPTATPTPRPNVTPRPNATPTPRPNATPTPRPNATPTPRPNATPTPRPNATPDKTAKPGSSAAPTPSPSPSPTAAAIAPSPSASTPPGASPTPRPASPTASPSAGVLIAGGDDGGPIASPILNVPNLDGSSPVIELDGLFLSSSFSAFAWIVPGFLLGLPGLLVLLVVGAQAAAAAVFIPVTRRMLGRSHHGGRQLAR